MICSSIKFISGKISSKMTIFESIWVDFQMKNSSSTLYEPFIHPCYLDVIQDGDKIQVFFWDKNFIFRKNSEIFIFSSVNMTYLVCLLIFEKNRQIFDI
jgi:hypothetical protein